MKILITGVCGFVGSVLARELMALREGLEIFGLDNFSREGSEMNRLALRRLGVRVQHGDLRLPSDLESLPEVDWVIDAAANPSVLAGARGGSGSSRQVLEHNLLGTINLLEFCKERRAGFLLLSTSRVYSVETLAGVPLRDEGMRFVLDEGAALPAGIGESGITEECATSAPISLYGATKLASEVLALEYGAAFDLPVWIDRCGVLAGAGQFGRADQGIMAFWLHSYARRAPMKYVGFGGLGQQVRDFLHPRDLARLVAAQIAEPTRKARKIVNLGGGVACSASLAELSAWSEQRFGFAHPIAAEPVTRQYDIPWVIMDARRASAEWDWAPQVGLEEMCEEIARHAEENPDWLERTSGQRPPVR